MRLRVIKEIIKSRTLNQTFLVSTSTILNGILGIIFYILMARFLGTNNFGIFFISVTAISLISDVSKLGIDTGIVNFVGRHIDNDKEKALMFLKYGLKILLVTSLTIIVIIWFFVPFLSNSLFFKSELINPFRIALFGVLTLTLFIFSTSSLQALQKFWVWGTLNVSMNFVRLVVVVFLYIFGYLSISSALLIYISIPLLGFLVSFTFLPNFLNVKNENKIAYEFIKFNKWVIVFTVISAVGSRLDTLLSGRFLSLSDLGVYSVAVNLTSVIPQIVVAIAAVVAPKLTKFNDSRTAIKYLKKLQLFIVFLSLLGFIFGGVIGYYLINNYYGLNYKESFTPFMILLFAQVIFLISIPVHSAVLYYFSYPKLFFVTTSINLFITLVSGYVFIPMYGYIGASIIVLIGNLSNFIIPFLWVYFKFKEIK